MTHVKDFNVAQALRNWTLAASLLAAASGAQAASLADELRGLMQQHPMIRSASLSLEASSSSVSAARASFLPRVDLTADAGKEKIETALSTDESRRKQTLSVTQNLYAGGRSQAGVSLAELDQDVQKNAYRNIVQSTLMEGISAYLQVARFQTLIAIAKRNEATTQRQLNLEDERVQRGGGVTVDVLQAKTRLQIAKERRVFYEQNLRDAASTYKQVFGHEPDLATLQDVGAFTEGVPASLDEAVRLAKENNPAVQESLLQSQRAGQQVNVEQAGFMPNVDLVAQRSKERNVNQVAKREETSVLLRMNWNLFAGNETASRKAAAIKQHEAQIEREAAIARKTEENARVAWSQMVNGKERETLLENAANIAYEVMGNRKRLRDAGKETALNVLDAEGEYYGVLSNKFNASYDMRLGSYRLLQAGGQLSPDLLGLGADKSKIPAKPLQPMLDDNGK